MKLLHTSDWHLGRSLYDKKRYDEFDSFLKWLVKFISEQKIEMLLVSGDIFDTTTPSNRAQELYYNFLSQMAVIGCRNIVIVGGNHDSPTFLEAPKPLLGAMKIYVVGAATGNPAEEIFLIKDSKGTPEAIVCAIPYLRDRDIRLVEDGESIDDKTEKLQKGISQHYSKISSLAQDLQDRRSPVPIIGMGHLFTTDAKTTDGDGIRELYVGSIAHVDGHNISEGFDYMALGHLHLAQKVGGSETIRYSGSPLQMSFAEASHAKKVVVVDFDGLIPKISEHDIPCFRKLEVITGDIDTISEKIKKLKAEECDAWLEVEITSSATAINITGILDELLSGSKLEILRIKNRNIIQKALAPLAENETLGELNDSEVFARCLDANQIIDSSQREVLQAIYSEAINDMQSFDSNSI